MAGEAPRASTAEVNSIANLMTFKAASCCNFSSVINVITEKALEVPDIEDVNGLLWIARDLAERLAANSEDLCSSQNIVKAN